MNKLLIDNYISPLLDTYQCSCEETLMKALSKLDSNEDVLFIFNNQQKFLGIITIYRSLYKNNHAPTTKVQNALTQALHVTSNTSIYDVAQYMADEQVFVLPFFSEDKVTGVFKAKEILKLIQKDKEIFSQVAKNLLYNQVKTASLNATVADIYPQLKDTGAMGIVITDNNGKADGFINRNDLKHSLIEPTNKQRFGKNGNRLTDRSFDEEGKRRTDNPVRKYLSKNITYLDIATTPIKIINKLLTSSSDMIVLIDKNNKPIKSVSVKEILASFASLKPVSGINIIIKKPSKNVSEEEFQHAYKSLVTFSEKASKRNPLQKILVTTEEPKYPDHHTAVYNSTIIIVPYSEGQYTAQAKGKTYTQSLKSAMSQLQKQQRRDHSNENNFTPDQSLREHAI